jgi:ABC-type polysaccharide/polyol phosphate transport system ATPase subunit
MSKDLTIKKPNASCEEFAIKVDHVSKTFKIPHEKITSIRGATVNLFRSGGYEEFKALDDVSFEVKKGEFFGIIGRNGSGKSTLLKILAGIYQPDTPVKSGKAGLSKDEFHGLKINGMISPFLELGIGFNPELSGRDNVYLNATVLGLSKKEIDKKFDSIVAFSELKRFIDQKLKNYSSGMQVRLAFSVSIHANRDILLMDEVLAVGDSNFQSKCLEEFNKYKEAGKTVILVTHDIGTVERYCDRAMLLRNGKIKMIGKADEVANKYVYENMSDEEKRLIDEQKNKKSSPNAIPSEIEGSTKIKETQSQKIAEITDVKFLNKDGKEKNVFETGESLDIKISFKIYKEIDFINIGLSVYSENNGQIFGYTTQDDEYVINKSSREIFLHFDELSILKGEYFINVSCFGKEEQLNYDFKPKLKILKIFSSGIKNNYKGVLCANHKWKKIDEK